MKGDNGARQSSYALCFFFCMNHAYLSFHSQFRQYVIYIPSFSHDVDLKHDMKFTFRGRQLELCRPLYSSSTFSCRFKFKKLGDLANAKVMVYLF